MSQFHMIWPDLPLPPLIIPEKPGVCQPEKQAPPQVAALGPGHATVSDQTAPTDQVASDQAPSDQAAPEQVLFSQARRWYSADIRLLLAIQLWDCIGRPRQREGVSLLNSFDRRRQHTVDPEGLEFMQDFLNTAAAKLQFQIRLPCPFRHWQLTKQQLWYFLTQSRAAFLSKSCLLPTSQLRKLQESGSRVGRTPTLSGKGLRSLCAAAPCLLSSHDSRQKLSADCALRHVSPSIKLTQWGGLERGASALLPLVLIRCEGGHLLLDNVLHLAGSEDADPLLCALNATWNMIFRGEFDSPAGLKVATPDMTVCKLGDFVAFCASHGCSPKAGTGRMLGLAVLLLQQVGDALALDQFRMFVLEA